MTAEECREVVKVHMLAAESGGDIPQAIALASAYAAIRDQIFNELPPETKADVWRGMGITESDIKCAIDVS